jgi:hypothetical protein
VKKHATVFAGVGRGGGWHFFIFFENTRRARPTVLATALVFTKRNGGDDDVAQPRASKQSKESDGNNVATTIATHQKVHRSM